MSTELLNAIRQFIIGQFVYDPAVAERLTSDTPLIDEGILDSFGIFEVIQFIEQHYGVHIDDEEVTPYNMGSIEGMVELVQSKQTT